MTSGNKSWAFAEAKRRANVMNRAYGIYQHKRYEEDHVIRRMDDSPPNPKWWVRVSVASPEEK